MVHATDIKADFEDKLTDQFAEALRKALPKAKHLRPEGGDDAPDVSLTILFPVTSDGKHFDYAVDLLKVDDNPTPDRLASFTARARETAIDVCAQRPDRQGRQDREGLIMDLISILSIFVLACCVGYYVVWSVTPRCIRR